MRSSGRTKGGSGSVRIASGCLVLLALVDAPRMAHAQENVPGGVLPDWIDRLPVALYTAFSREETAAATLLLGIIAFALTVAILLVRTRRRLRESEGKAADMLAELRSRLDRAEGLLAADQQVLVVWDESGRTPEIRCQPGTSRDLPGQPADVLAFGKWLAPESAGELDDLVERLRQRGGSFNVMLRARGGGYVEADGRTSGGRAALRLRDLGGQRRELAEIYDRHKQLIGQVESMRTLLASVPMPAWMRDVTGTLSWVNQAYCGAVGGSEPQSTITAGHDLLAADDRQRADAALASQGRVHERLAVVFDNQRRVLDVFEAGTRHGSAGIAVDVTETEHKRAELARLEEAHASTLDKVTTGVAVFGADQRLKFYNSAFRELWPLDDSFLAAGPSYGEILDRLRALRRLPEQVDYRAWRNRQTEALPTQETRAAIAEGAAREGLWHLPDGQILRVIRSTHPDGGIACFFEDVTRSLDLESRFVALTSVQRETLDSLDEGIAVFGSDGRLKLHNPAFAAIWRLAEKSLVGEPHVGDVISWCRPLYAGDAVWQAIAAAVTSFADSRESIEARIERPDGSIIDLRALPLPDGATLAVFKDVSDSARIEKALRDRNEALVAAERIKNEFVHKVSYELRSPLTNIIGFAQLMSEEATGPLNDRQQEYTGYILNSSGALLAIINDILDLATIDAGVMELELGEVDIARTVSSTVDAIGDRFAEEGVKLAVDIESGIGAFEADEKRIRQILFNLLSNAVGFSEPGQTVRLVCRRQGGDIALSVADEGPGIPEDVRRAVFERFESHALGTRHRGVGLGLAIVKSFVELHDGVVTLHSEPGRGTKLTCVFPRRRREQSPNADGPEIFPETATVARLQPRPTVQQHHDLPLGRAGGGMEVP